VLRWGLQRGCAVIPKSEHEGRIKENLQLFGFSLAEEDMEKMEKLEKKLRFNDPGYFCPKNFKTPCPIWE